MVGDEVGSIVGPWLGDALGLEVVNTDGSTEGISVSVRVTVK
jgi:hypothetical protein